MGWCHEFGPVVAPPCDHPMTAGPGACHCEKCGFTCTGRFSGCEAVWARGPRKIQTQARAPMPARRLPPPPSVSDDPPQHIQVDLTGALEDSFAGLRQDMQGLTEQLQQSGRSEELLAYLRQLPVLIDLLETLPARVAEAISQLLEADQTPGAHAARQPAGQIQSRIRRLTDKAVTMAADLDPQSPPRRAKRAGS